MSNVNRNTRLPRRPQFVRVELDEDMAPEGPLWDGRWPGAERTLTYHSFAAKRLKRGTRVCVNAGVYEGCFGTVLGRSIRYRGFTYGVRLVRTKTIEIPALSYSTETYEVEVA